MHLVSRAALIFAVFLFPLHALGDPSAAEKHFLDKVKPLLESRCVSCHGPDKVKGGLRLDSRAAALKGGQTGPGVVPGKPKESLILQAVMHVRADLEMPPKEKLTDKDVAVLEKWIAEGAAWPETASAKVEVVETKAERIGDAWTDPRNPIVRIFGGQRLDLWSLKPISNPKSQIANRSAIDHFILTKLREKGLSLSHEADKRTLIRRVTYGLTGLPPTNEEVAAFLGDDSTDAYEKVVDRLLASPAYGEHQARWWLDVIRYSDSNGFDWDEYRKEAWRFRDYVIRSFNADKPFDQFVREQLAGDELLDGPPKNAAEQDRLIATTYLRLGPHDNAAPLFNEQARSRAELMSDLTETTASAFLGLTMGCCRCHDHKFDPLSQADHYRLRAFFEPVKFADDLAIDLAKDQEAIKAHNEKVDAEVKALADDREAMVMAVREKVRADKIRVSLNQVHELLSIDPNSKELKAKFEAVQKKVTPSEREIVAALPENAKKQYESLGKQIESKKKERRAFTTAMLITDAAGPPGQTKILFQGDHKQPRDAVEPGFISVLDPNAAAIRKGVNAKTTGRRLTLAEWIVSPNNPLTARVLVNRIWQQHFGRGIVATANDFGLAGARPTHPELLDHLASEMIKHGWSIKQMHRYNVTSATYRQAAITSTAFAKIDANNDLLWRQNLRRLSAEQLRDSLLAVSGLLNDKTGGPPAWPELPADVLQANPAFLDDNAEKTKGWYPSAPADRNVRSVYMIAKRTVRVPFMEAFDLPENATSCPRRNESTVAPQAMTLLNGPDATAAANAFAQRIEKAAGDDAKARVRTVFAIALQRWPDEKEERRCVEFLRDRSLVELCRAVMNLNEFIYVD
jgi:hypothetical protein